MSLTRRYFLKSAAALSAAASLRSETFAQPSASSSPNEKFGVAVVGTGGRGSGHISDLLNHKDVDLKYVCDADLQQAERAAKNIQAKGAPAPQVERDYRRILDDPSIDVISIATPNHWHSLQAIQALQAGKHVYVEKPVSHNVWEGRQLVGWARHTGKMCQAGTQSRSSPSLTEAVEFIQSGGLGKIQYAVGTCYKPRKSIGKLDKPLVIPESVDYDLWCGPAAKVDLYRPKLHYDWHWDFNTGNGDMGNQGIHQMDIARWFLGEKELSPLIASIGGRVGYDDAGDTPNTQIVYHGYEKAPLIFETRGLPSKDLDWKNPMDKYRGSQVGVIVQCEKGYIVIPSYTQCTAFDNDGKEIKTWKGGGNHFSNLFGAIRSGKTEDLNGEILEGHLSSALCHTGAISHVLGSPKKAAEIEQSVADNKLWKDSYDRLAAHLAANGVDISDPKLNVGPWLKMDPKTERFTNSEEANKLLTREYRKGYEVPEAPKPV
ncbi:MAG TPA: Gfo/Idh/MocA family oxidoreductase [Planctomicrobium sp.]|nr:Gfo/Idh/MocA family oxidoreductase [Planctomicrobium sp.]